MESNIENEKELTTTDELNATDLAEISGGTGYSSKKGHKKGGGGKSITTGNIKIIDDIGSDNTINIFDGPSESS